MKKTILFTILLILTLNFNAFGLSIESTTHSPGQVYFVINGSPPFNISRSINNLDDFVSVGQISTNQYYEQGLPPGSIYWYFIEEVSTGETLTIKYSSPYTTIDVLPLQLLQLGDEYVHVTWSQLVNTVDLYLDGDLYLSDISENEITITDLLPGTEHTLYYIDSSGMISNTIRFTTSKELDNLINRLDDLLRKLFVSDDYYVDTNNDGTSDGLQPIRNKFDEVMQTGPFQYPKDIKDSVINASNKVTASTLGELPTFNVTYMPGFTINVFDFTGLETQVKLIREILVAVLYVSLFIYFLRKLIPSLKA